MQYVIPLKQVINEPISIESWFVAIIHIKDTTRKLMSKIWVVGKCTTLGVGGPGEELSWGDTRSGAVVPGIATLDRGPDQYPVG